MKTNALIVFVKNPNPGHVKTRLCPPLTFEQSAELYSAFLKDSYLRYNELKHTEIYYYYAPEFGCESLQKLLPDVTHWYPQEGKDLGERMHHAFMNVLSTHKSVIIVGSDHPDLPNSYLKKGFDVLNYVDVSLGKSKDGGYYCIGLKKPNKHVFENIEWSTPTVYETTLERINTINLDLFKLPEWYDIDDIQSLDLFLENNDLKKFKNINSALSNMIYKKVNMF